MALLLQVDLCHGPHLPNTGYLKASAVNAFNRAFWRADVNKEHLQVGQWLKFVGSTAAGQAKCCISEEHSLLYLEAGMACSEQ